MTSEIKKCEYEGCNEPATTLAEGRSDYRGQGHDGVGNYCEAHACVVADEDRPEYIVSCPNCGCKFGVN